MSQQNPSGKIPRWVRSPDAQWVAVILTVVLALISGAYWAGTEFGSPSDFDSTLTTTPTATAAVTETVTAAPTEQPLESGAPSTSAPGAVDGAVFWQGTLDWKDEPGYSLDFNPPKHVPANYISTFDGGRGPYFTTYYSAGSSVVDWTAQAVPSRNDCAKASAEGRSETESVVDDSYVCGETTEGRIFRIHIVTAGDKPQTEVTVWGK